MKHRTYDDQGRVKNFCEDYTEKSSNGLNFLDCLRKYLGKEVPKCPVESRTISWNWSTIVFNNYINNIYEKRIIPNINLSKPLSDFTQDDIQIMLEKIERKETKETKSILSTCERLFNQVYVVCVMRKEFENKLGLHIPYERETKSEESEQKIKKRRLSRKSLDLDEEIALATYFKNLDLKKASGEDLGVLLMLCLGLRNNEAAGLSFNNITQIADKNFYVAFVLKSTVGDTNVIKAGGKTSNMPRVLPLFPFLFEILEKRKVAIINTGIAEAEVNEYPIACVGTDYKKRCTRDDITNRARFLFKEVTNNKEKDALDDLKSKLEKYDIEEKDSTAYLLRRNTATHLYALGLTPGQIQYYIGHEIENDNDLRSFYVSPDRLEDLYKILLNHPLNVLFDKPQDDIKITIDPNSSCYIRIVGSEPGQSIHVRANKLNSQQSLKVVQSSASLDNFDRYINIRKKTDEVYMSLKKAKED